MSLQCLKSQDLQIRLYILETKGLGSGTDIFNWSDIIFWKTQVQCILRFGAPFTDHFRDPLLSHGLDFSTESLFCFHSSQLVLYAELVSMHITLLLWRIWRGGWAGDQAGYKLLFSDLSITGYKDFFIAIFCRLAKQLKERIKQLCRRHQHQMNRIMLFQIFFFVIFIRGSDV